MRSRRLVNASPVARSSSRVDARTTDEGVPVVRCPAELERPRHLAAQPPRPEVVARLPGGRILEQRPVVPLDRRAHRLDQPLAPSPLARLAGRRVGELHPGLGRQVLDGADEVDVLVLLDEREHVARLVAPEALVAPGLLADVERRRPLGVERAQPDPVATGLAQGDELADDVDDRHRRPQPLDVVVGDGHVGSRRSKTRSARCLAGPRRPTLDPLRCPPAVRRRRRFVGLGRARSRARSRRRARPR